MVDILRISWIVRDRCCSPVRSPRTETCDTGPTAGHLRLVHRAPSPGPSHVAAFWGATASPPTRSVGLLARPEASITQDRSLTAIYESARLVHVLNCRRAESRAALTRITISINRSRTRLGKPPWFPPWAEVRPIPFPSVLDFSPSGPFTKPPSF
jgi:hypothetical protein